MLRTTRSAKKRSSTSFPARRCHLTVEALEERAVPTILVSDDNWGPAGSLSNPASQDLNTSLMWSDSGSLASGSWYTYSGAVNYVTQLNTRATHGFNDWRLPTRAELEEAASHGLFNHGLISTVHNWSSTKQGKDQWTVRLVDGNTVLNATANALDMVAVRGTRSPAGYTTANVRVFSQAVTTGEDGGIGYFTVALDTQPNADVTFSLDTSDTSEGNPDRTSLTFTPTNWNIPQWVKITPADDNLFDPDTTYTIELGATQSADPDYNSLEVPDVTVTNKDNEQPFLLTRQSDFTTEAGGTTTMTVRLGAPPQSGPVFVDISSRDTTEGNILSPTKLIFDSTNWDQPQTFTVIGVDDAEEDGDVQYQVQIAVGVGPNGESSSTEFQGAERLINFKNVDNDGVYAVYSSGAVNLPIKDLQTTTSTITVSPSAAGTVLDVNAFVRINHTYDSDLRVTLVAPDGTSLVLLDRIGGSGDNFGAGTTPTTVDDEATQGIWSDSAPFDGRYRLVTEPLSLFDGKNAAGNWVLRVEDLQRKDTGTLVEWGLELRATTPAGGSSLVAAGGTGTTGSGTMPLSSDQLQPILSEAIARWQAAGMDTSPLNTLDIRIADLGGSTLGLASGNTIWLDDNAAGWGWFVDETPWEDSEFLLAGNQGEQNQMDLLSVLAHELGHVLGYDHTDEGVMQETLSAGVRHIPGQLTMEEAELYAWALVQKEKI